ncbi:unnamed protein product [Coregonus sp. 'balchen']|nr:unnamed protein product [Coregonus sp. 'balchen']
MKPISLSHPGPASSLCPSCPLSSPSSRASSGWYHTSSLPQELYIFHCSGLLKPAVCDMVKRLSLHESLLGDLDVFYQAHRDMHYAKHFLKEALQLVHKSCLYYPIYPSYHSQRNSCANYLTSVLNCMVPVRPPRQIVYPLEELGINTPSKPITKDQAPYALNHINQKLTMEPKVTIDARIVIVRASDTGLAFFPRCSLFAHTCRFNNMTLISTHGFPGYYTKINHCYCDRDHTQLSLHSWINVVTGKMVGIDRAAKHVLVLGGRKVPYNHLILPFPSNLFTLKNHYDCVTVYQWLLKNFVELEDNTIIYSNTIDVYACVGTLLSLGVEGFRIHLVHLPTDEDSSCSPSSCFSNHLVEKAMKKALENSGVHVHHNCLLAQMNDGQNPESITFLSFTSDSQPLRLECSLRVDYDAFQSINNACLVYDGRLVIDTTFHTSDSTIHAAGPLTKFPRRYLADQWSHSRFNSRETGNYFHLHLNQYDMVETITCLSLKPLPVSNYLCLYWKHELLLNHLCSRYDEGLVHDLYRLLDERTNCVCVCVCVWFCTYFREKWCLAIYHDHFADFDHNDVSITELIQRMVDEKLDIIEPNMFLKKVFEESGGLASLKTSTLNYLRYNRYHVSMYAQPGLL